MLITGGGSGIGLGLAEELVRRGNEVIICGRRRDRLEEAKARIGKLEIVTTDVGDHDARQELAHWIIENFPQTNVLVNNAGVQRTYNFLSEEASLRTAREEIEINLVGPIHLSTLFSGHLASKDAAAIINVTSGLAFAPLAHVPVYCATKAALHSLSLSMRHQFRNTSVRVFEMAPPIVATELGIEHRPPQLNKTAMTVEAAVAGMIDAFERDVYEVGLGDAARMMEKREQLFAIMNQQRDSMRNEQ